MGSGPPLTRRQFLRVAAGAGVAGAAGLVVARHPWSSAAGTGRHLESGKGILVLVTLYGGNDGLNTLIPSQDGRYLSGRAALGYRPEEVIALSDGLALHPSMKGFKQLWDAKHLAIVRGVGYPNPSRSHFRSMDIWQTASPETAAGTGWLGRWLDRERPDPLRALSFGPSLPTALAGANTSGSAVPGGPLRLPGDAAVGSAISALAKPAAGTSPLAARVAASNAGMLAVEGTLRRALAASPAEGATNLEASRDQQSGQRRPPGVAGLPTLSTLKDQLDVVARLIKAGVPSRVHAVALGGFDTHSDEKGTHARLLAQLDQAVTGFFAALHGDARRDRVVLMTYSEFGRRVAANASGGTDHGTAAPLFLAGWPVKGGFYGEEPSLGDLDDGDLKFTTDFRSVYSTVLGEVLGMEPRAVLGKPYPSLGFL